MKNSERRLAGFANKRSNWSWSLITLGSLGACLLTGTATAQKDPGPRDGPAAAGDAYPTLTWQQKAFFNQSLSRFNAVDSVSGKIAGEGNGGLGPTYNANSCAACHSQPSIGGSSPGLASPQKSVPNPLIALASLDGAANSVPSFLSSDGPVREVRYKSDGGVRALFTIGGRIDATGCTLPQPDFSREFARGNVSFRIPTPLYGLGLVENTSDETLQANLATDQQQKQLLGINGVFNRSANDGTISRFGWKAQNKSLLMFSGEAYNVEIGVTNDLFPNERSTAPGCLYNRTPEDSVNVVNPTDGSLQGTGSVMSSDVVNFAIFARLLAPPEPAKQTLSSQNGQMLFSHIGCNQCHSISLTAAASPYAGMGHVTYHPFSDFAVHHMGSGLADGITQGAAGPDQFRTAPLWGLGQRLYFLHDGRTDNLLEAIRAHASQGSEANRVMQLFSSLNSSQVQDILNFLRTL